MLLIGVAASIVGIAITLAMDWFPEQGSTAADDIDTLYDVLLIASVPVFVLVMTIAIYCVIRFRARPGDLSDGAPIHGNTRLEVIWVTIPFIMVTALAIYGWVVLDDIEAKQDNELVVNVTGQQFAWRFEYPAEKVQSNQLVLPVDRPVEFKIHSEDVIHSFWVPGVPAQVGCRAGDHDHDPGDAQQGGQVPGGLRRAVRHRPLDDAPAGSRRPEERSGTTWIADRQRRAEGGGGEEQAAADGKAIFTETGCNACHTLADAEATGDVGPYARRPGRQRPQARAGHRRGGVCRGVDRRSGRRSWSRASRVT